MRQDIPASRFSEMALQGLATSLTRMGAQGAEFGRGHPSYSAAKVSVAFGTAPSTRIGTHPSLAYAYNTPGVRFGDRTKSSSRPVSKDGATSFHFSHTYISKTSNIRQLIREHNGGKAFSNSTAENHLLYIERDGAAEVLEQPAPGQTQSAPDVSFSRAEAAVAARSSMDQQEYLERIGAPEQLLLGSGLDPDLSNLKIASFGNIGTTPHERGDFWREVNEFEQNPRGERVTLHLQDNDAMWRLLYANARHAPRPLNEHLKAWKKSDSPRDINITQVDTNRAFDLYKWLKGLHPEFPVEIEPGRGGRVQTRIIAELPHELTPHQRLKIVQDFTRSLTGKGLPFWAVIHAPDANNDRRNYHVHIIYYDRPCARMPDPKDPKRQVWDFQIQEEIIYASRNRRQINPYAQPKDRETNSKRWILSLRAAWEQACNETLESAGATKRYDRRTYEKMGINLDPLKHIPSKTFNKERKGDVTVEGVDLARRQWDVLLESVVNKNATRTHVRIENLDARVKKIAQTLQSSSPYQITAIAEVRRLSAVGKVHARAVGLAELMQDVARVLVDRLASRAKLIFHGSADAQAKKRRGRPGKNPNSTTILTPEAKEAARYLQTLILRAQEMDETNSREVTIARGQFAIITRRLDHLGAAPHLDPEDRTQSSANLVDRLQRTPEQREQRTEKMIERMVSTVNDLWTASKSGPVARTAMPVAPRSSVSASQSESATPTNSRPPASPSRSKSAQPEGAAPAKSPAAGSKTVAVKPSGQTTAVKPSTGTKRSTTPAGTPLPVKTIPAKDPASSSGSKTATAAPAKPPASGKPQAAAPVNAQPASKSAAARATASRPSSAAPANAGTKGTPNATASRTQSPTGLPAAASTPGSHKTTDKSVKLVPAGSDKPQRPIGPSVGTSSVAPGKNKDGNQKAGATVAKAPLPVRTIKPKASSATEARQIIANEKAETKIASEPAPKNDVPANTPNIVPEGQPLPVKKIIRRKSRKRDDGYGR